MATQDQTKNALAQTGKPQGLEVLIKNSVKALGQALPSHMNPERIVRIALTAIRLNPELAKCTPASFMGSLFTLAQLGLEPVAGRAYLLPFNNKRKIGGTWTTVKEVQAIVGYKGYADLFYRHESALSIDMQAVYANDDFDYAYGTESFIRHKPAMQNRGEAIAYYAVAKMKGGASVFRVMSKEDAVNHGKKHSKTYDKKAKKFYDFSPWVKDEDAMCQKTLILQLAKLIPLSIEMQKAMEVDETSRDYREGVSDALDLPVTTSWIESETEQLENKSKRETPLPVDVKELPEGVLSEADKKKAFEIEIQIQECTDMVSLDNTINWTAEDFKALPEVLKNELKILVAKKKKELSK